jgi:hypothetical protein
VLLDRLDISEAEFADQTGWEMKPEGACQGEVCVPLASAGPFDVLGVAERLCMAVVEDEEAGWWAFGPGSLGGRALLSAEAPDLVLPDLDGEMFRLSSLRGQKVMLVSWAPY